MIDSIQLDPTTKSAAARYTAVSGWKLNWPSCWKQRSAAAIERLEMEPHDMFNGFCGQL